MKKIFNERGIRNLLTLVLLSAALMGPDLQAQDDKVDFAVLQQKVATLDLSYGSTSIQSGEKAELALNETEIAQEELRIWYLQAENNCYDKFFVTSCINDSKLVRRKLFAILQRISVEAKAFQRKEHIDQLDADLLQKNTPPLQ
ncbi:hypothetical protein [Undibacterium sp. Ren11W]|uniref:hypothetical protein n=1 Tax=Undibacterium sp. Ren11W TaxID=3413045 RepID=UPI003BF20A8C